MLNPNLRSRRCCVLYVSYVFPCTVSCVTIYSSYAFLFVSYMFVYRSCSFPMMSYKCLICYYIVPVLLLHVHLSLCRPVCFLHVLDFSYMCFWREMSACWILNSKNVGNKWMSCFIRRPNTMKSIKCKLCKFSIRSSGPSRASCRIPYGGALINPNHHQRNEPITGLRSIFNTGYLTNTRWIIWLFGHTFWPWRSYDLQIWQNLSSRPPLPSYTCKDS